MNQMRYEELIEKYLKNNNIDLEKLIKDEGIAKDLAEKIYSEWKNYHDEVFWHNAIYEISFMEEPPTPGRIMNEFQISYVFAEALYNYYMEVANDYMGDTETNNVLSNLNSLYDCLINEEAFNETIGGSGDEKDKIDSLYSSSRQSLLVFNKLKDKEHKEELTFKLNHKNVVFNDVIFEYKNKVIGYPSNVDVVLISKDKESVLFIESKFNEIIRYSVSKDKFIENSISKKSNTQNVAGVSYFRDGTNSYEESLNLNKEELTDLGFDVKDDDFIQTGYRAIKPINGNESVYPYGIKQFLSHIIGIRNVFNPDDKCSKTLKDMNSIKNIYFMTLINSYYNYSVPEEKNPDTMIKDFVNHYLTIEEYLNKNKSSCLKTREKEIKINLCGIHSYQWLYDNNKGYFKDLGKVVDFYKLNREDKIEAMTKKD